MAEIVQSKLTAKRPWMFQSRRRLLASLFLMFLIPTLAFTALTAFFISNEMSNQAREETMVTARLVSRHLEDEFFGLRSYVHSFATRRGVLQALSGQREDWWREQLIEMVGQNKKISRGVLVDKSGVLLFDYPHLPGAESATIDKDWFRGVVRKETPYVSETYQRVRGDQSLVVMIASPVTDENANIVGYLGAQYQVSQILQWLESIRAAEWERIALLDQRGQQVSSGGVSGGNVAGHPAVHNLLRQPQGSLVLEDFDGFDRALVSYAPVRDLGWTVLAYQDEDVIFAPTRRLLALIFVFFLVAISVLGIVAWLWYRTLFNYAEDLRRSNKELENFCYSIAHDLRAPLRSMQGFTTMLAEDYADKFDDRGKDCGRRIVAASQRMDRLIGDLLDYGSISHTNLEFRRVELEEALNRALDRISARFHQLGAECEIRKPLGTVSADRIVLIGVLQQILSNAIKFRRQGQPPRVEVWSEARQSFVRLWIKDNGIGISREHQDKIFGVFQRLHRTDVYSGTGIGLAIVKKGVERMGGTVGVTSEPGQGSSFWIELPQE